MPNLGYKLPPLLGKSIFFYISQTLCFYCEIMKMMQQNSNSTNALYCFTACTRRGSGDSGTVLSGKQKWLCCKCSRSAKIGFWFLTQAKLRNVIKLDLLHCSLTSGKLHLWFLVQWKGANYLFKCSFNVLQWHKAWVQPPACLNLPELSPWLLALISLFHFSSAPSLCPSKAPAVCQFFYSWINLQCCLLQLAPF